MSTQLILKEDNPVLFWQAWEDLVGSQGCSSRYFRISLEHDILIAKIRGKHFADKSFVYLENNRPLAMAFLPVEKIGDYYLIANDINDGYVDAPICANEAVEKKVYTMIDELARNHHIAKIMLAINPLEKKPVGYNYLQKYDYLDTTILKFVIDLSAADLLAGCRKGHRNDIKKYLQADSIRPIIVNQDNFNLDLCEQYKLLHYKCAGRVTWPQEFFESQYQKIKQGIASLVGLEYEGRNVAFSYFEHGNGEVIYASGADDPDYDKLPLYHLMLYYAMTHFQRLGARHIDTEQPASPSAQWDYYPDAKQHNIAFFKRGFPGDYLS